jgi:hypothetical protein
MEKRKGTQKRRGMKVMRGSQGRKLRCEEREERKNLPGQGSSEQGKQKG